MTGETLPGAALEAIWHDLECGGYAADLELWEELTAGCARDGGQAEVLDLGCGTGRVTLFLARLGHRVTALDRDPGIVETLASRAAVSGLDVATVVADARAYDLDRRFDLVLAPMQLVQLMPGGAERRALLERAHAHLRPGGSFAAALLDLSGEPLDAEYLPPLPDMREKQGCVYSSQPVAIRLLDGGRAISLDRERRVVSPEGEVHVSAHRVRLELVSPQELAQEVSAAGFVPEAETAIAPTEDHVGSVVVVARRQDG
jgi:SAM-dependent methyltransferase